MSRVDGGPKDQNMELQPHKTQHRGDDNESSQHIQYSAMIFNGKHAPIVLHNRKN